MNAVIFGGGPCGLTAAWDLANAGVDVTVIERDRAPGGLCKTTRRDGYQFDLGGHRFISADQLLINDISSLLGDRLLTRERKSIIRFAGRQYDYPINLVDAFTKSSLPDTARFAAGYFASSIGFTKSSAPADSFEAWVDNRFGKPLADYFFKPYTEKLWGIPAARLSSDWAAQRISTPDLKQAIIKSIGLTGSKPRSYASKYHYPEGGIGQIFEAMAQDIERKGGKILTGARPVAFLSEKNTICQALIEKESGEKVGLDADFFLSTIPLDQLVSLLEPDEIEPLPFRSLRFLNIVLDGVENVSPNTWMYTPEKDILMTRVQEPKRRSPYSAPEGKTSLMLEIPCEKDEYIWNVNGDDLMERAIVDLGKLGFDFSANVSSHFSTYAEHAYPRYGLGYSAKVRTLRNVVKRYDNLDTLGRQGLFKYIFMDTAMLMGRRWASKIINGTDDNEIENIHNAGKVIEAGSVV